MLMENSLKVLKERNIRPTQQRLEVHRILLVTGRHLTAEEIHEMAKVNLPTLSLATIYTVLDLFRQKHVINEVRMQDDCSRFEARIDPHHHFFCKLCRQIYDLNLKPCKALKQREADGNIIEQLQGYFYGTCKNCR